MTRPPRPAWQGLTVAGLALLASLPALPNRFALDDVPLVATNPRVHQLLPPLSYFQQTYWPPEITASLYRPVTVLGFAVQWSLGGGAPWVFHLGNALLYLGLALAVLRLARQLLPPGAAVVAGALFAVHPVHAEAVGGIVGQSELIVALCTVLAASRYLEARRRAVMTPADIGSVAGLFLLGAFAKEQGLMLPGVLLALEATVVRDPRPAAVRMRELWPLARVLLLAAVGYLVARSAVVAGLAGDTPNVGLRGAGLAGRVLTMLAIVPIWSRLLFVPWHLQADYMPREVPTIPYLGWWPALGLAILLVAALACWQARGRQPVTLAAVAWIAITLFPVSNLVVPTGILVAERTLLLPSVGAMLLVGVAVTALATHGLTVAVAAGVVVAAWAGRTVARLPAWHDSDRLLAASLRDAPRSYKVRWDHARALARAGDTTAAEREFDAALGLYPDDPALLAELGDRRRDAGRCGAAIPFYRQAIAREPARWVTRTRLILCLAREGRRDAAHAELAELERRGEGDPVRLRLTIRADSLMAAPAREGPR